MLPERGLLQWKIGKILQAWRWLHGWREGVGSRLLSCQTGGSCLVIQQWPQVLHGCANVFPRTAPYCLCFLSVLFRLQFRVPASFINCPLLLLQLCSQTLSVQSPWPPLPLFFVSLLSFCCLCVCPSKPQSPSTSLLPHPYLWGLFSFCCCLAHSFLSPWDED